MKYYTEIVPFELAKKLKWAGFPQVLAPHTHFYTKLGRLSYFGDYDSPSETSIEAPTYAEVFDWLIEKGLSVELSAHLVVWKSTLWSIQPRQELFRGEGSFQEAADTAIETSCALLTEG